MPDRARIDYRALSFTGWACWVISDGLAACQALLAACAAVPAFVAAVPER